MRSTRRCSVTKRRITRFLTGEGELLVTGGALKSRGLEKFQRVFLEEMIKLLMAGKGAKVPAIHAEFEQKIRQRQWPVEFFKKTDTLQDSLSAVREEGGGFIAEPGGRRMSLRSKAGDRINRATKCVITSPGLARTCPPMKIRSWLRRSIRMRGMKMSNIMRPSSGSWSGSSRRFFQRNRKRGSWS